MADVLAITEGGAWEDLNVDAGRPVAATEGTAGRLRRATLRAGSRWRAQGAQVLQSMWLLAVLRDLMDRRVALEHLAPYVLAGTRTG